MDCRAALGEVSVINRARLHTEVSAIGNWRVARDMITKARSRTSSRRSGATRVAHLSHIRRRHRLNRLNRHGVHIRVGTGDDAREVLVARRSAVVAIPKGACRAKRVRTPKRHGVAMASMCKSKLLLRTSHRRRL